VNGTLTGSRVFASEVLFEKILGFVLKKDIEKVREELKSNYIPYPELYEYLYENVGKTKQPGLAIIDIGKHLYQDTTIAIKEINFMAMVVSWIYNKVV
jgi:hypothetical protein